jgi:hypothetical protein
VLAVPAHQLQLQAHNNILLAVGAVPHMALARLAPVVLVGVGLQMLLAQQTRVVAVVRVRVNCLAQARQGVLA